MRKLTTTNLTGQAKRRKSIEEHRQFTPAVVLAGDVGDQIRKLREAREITQERLAFLAGTSQPGIARLESGSVQPRLDTLVRVAMELDAKVKIAIEPVPASEYRTRDLPKGTPVPESRVRRKNASDAKPQARTLIGHFSANTDVDEIVDMIIATVPPDDRPPEDRPNRIAKPI